MHQLKWVLGFILITAALPAGAEFYKYVGPDGRVRYTDDYNQIPEAQRNKADKYVEYGQESKDTPAQTSKKQTVSDSVPASGGTIPDTTEDFDKLKKRLESRRQELMLEYEALMKEKEALDVERNKPKNHTQTITYNKKADAFNEKIKAYEIRLNALNSEFKAYNAAIQKRNEAAKETEDTSTSTATRP